MDANTLYYTLSTIPQVLGAVVAIAGAFILFRIQALTNLLIGDGRAALTRWDLKEPGYVHPDKPWLRDRLRDAVERGSVPEIDEVILELYKLEKEEGHTKASRPRGLQYLYEDRFRATKEHIARIKRLTFGVAALSFFSILLAICSLAFTVEIAESSCPGVFLMINIVFFTVSILAVLYLFYVGLLHKVEYEKANLPGE